MADEPVVFYEDDTLKIMSVWHLLKKHPNKVYTRIHNRKIDKVYFHHTGGRVRDGWETPRLVAIDHVTRKDWPGIAYHFCIPYFQPQKRPRIAYLTQPLDVWSYHTKLCNKHSIGVVLEGKFYSRYNPLDTPYAEQLTMHPTPEQMEAAMAVWLHCVLEFSLKNKALSCHSLAPFYAKKPTCPGDKVENWVEQVIAGQCKNM